MSHETRQPVTRFNCILARCPVASVVAGLRAEDRGNPTLAGVQAEHAAYREASRADGVEVTLLPALEDFPDSMFMEDPALVFSEGAIVLRPGASSRLREAAHLVPVLHQMFDTVIDLPGTGFAGGGDVLTTRDAVMIGLSAHTDRVGAEALIAALARPGPGLISALPG